MGGCHAKGTRVSVSERMSQGEEVRGAKEKKKGLLKEDFESRPRKAVSFVVERAEDAKGAAWIQWR